MTPRKSNLLLLSLALVTLTTIYFAFYQSGWKKRDANSGAIFQLDLSEFPDTFKTQLALAEKAVRSTTPSPASVLTLARLYHANGFYDQAESRYRILLNIDDKALRAKAHYYIATIGKAKSDYDTAIEHLTTTIELAPGYLPAHLSLAEIQYKSGHLSDAADSFVAALELDPTNPHALIGLARERIQNADDARALTYLKSLASSNPNSTNGASLLAQVLERNGQSEQAAVARKTSLAGWDLPPEDPWMEETLRYCYDTQQLSLLFEDYKRVGQIDRAMSYLDRIDTVDANNWNSRLLRAHAYTEMGEYSKSIPYYEQSLELGGDPTMIYPPLAKTYFKMAQFNEAESVARKGLLLSPNNTEVLETMAGIHLQKREPKEAITLFLKVVSIDPYHHLANTVLAKYYWQTDDRPAALTHLETLRQVDPSDVFSRVFLGQYYLENNLPFEALPSLEEAFAIDPKDEYVLVMLPDAYALIGKFQQNKGDFKGASKSYGKALSIDANHAEAAEGKASLLEKSSRID